MAERMRGVKALWAGQERRVALWMPTGIALGILLRLGEVMPVLALSAGFLLVLLILRMPGLLLMLTVAGGLASMALGALAMDLRLRMVAAPVLSEPLERRITGQVLAIDRTRAGLPRALLGEVSIDGLDPSATPRRARIAFLAAPELPELGTRIAVVVRLSPPPGPAEPGGFDFSRQAYFAGLGAVGYTRETPEIVAGVEIGGGWSLRIDRLRREIAIALRAQVGGAEGAVAAAITVGDRSGLTPETVAALRDSGLAHLLAISGLHIGLLSALVYTGLRLALSLHPVTSEAWPSRKIAALAGMLAAGAYLLLAGAGVATQRAFVMASVAFFAVLIDRPAVTLRALAMAGIVILLVRPESLFSAGFQMSFGAVTALVAGYEATRGMWRGRAARHGWRSRLTTVALATVMTSALAGMATAPFAAFHFNRLVLYGFIANLAATPLMGIWIMPCIIAAALLAPFGLEWIALAALEQGLAIILRIADFAATPEDAVIGIPASSDICLMLMLTGGLWVAVWRGYLRLAGILPIAISLLFWTSAVLRPDLLISEDAGLVGGRGADGQLWVSRERRDVFSAETWLRRDGEMPPDPLRAHARRDWSCDRAICSGTTGEGWQVVLLRNNRMTAALDCEAPTLVILPGHISRRSRDRIGQKCVQIDLARFAGASSIAVFLQQGDEPEIRAAYPWHLRGGRDQQLRISADSRPWIVTAPAGQIWFA